MYKLNLERIKLKRNSYINEDRLPPTTNANIRKPLSSRFSSNEFIPNHKLSEYPCRGQSMDKRDNSLTLNMSKLNLKPQCHKNDTNSLRNKSEKKLDSKRNVILDKMNLQEDKYFSDDLCHLIKNQHLYLEQFRKKIQIDKNKVNSDIEIFKHEIVNIIEDHRLSIIAALDQIFKQYIQSFSLLKQSLQHIKNQKQQIYKDISFKDNHKNTSVSSFHLNRNKNKSINISRASNQQPSSKLTQSFLNNQTIINSIKDNNEQFRKCQIFQYVDDLHKEKVKDIENKAHELILIGQFQNGFYISQQMVKLLNDSKSNLQLLWNIIYEGKHKYIRNIKQILNKSKQLTNSIYTPSKYNHQNISQHKYSSQNKYASQYKYPQIIINNPLNQITPKTTIKHHSKINITHSKDISLCIISIPNELVGIGSKDGTIGIYNISNGKQIQRLEGHKASVCCLSLLRCFNGDIYLASGSDHECNSVIVWEMNEWRILYRVQSHKAAVTGILDLMDGIHFISGSYDKKINIYEIDSGKIKYNLPNNKSSVTSIVMNKTGQKIISCGLDNSINLLASYPSIVSKLTTSSLYECISTTIQMMETIFLERVIKNNSMICSMLCSSIYDYILYIGAKDGRIKILDLIKGECQKTISCSSDGTAIIQLLAIQKDKRLKDSLIIGFLCYQPIMKLVNIECHTVEDIQLEMKSYIEFGCGVGPKCIWLTDNLIFGMISHSSKRQLNMYKVE